MYCAPSSAVTDGGPGLEQGLELPRLGPPLVVRDVRFEGADQRALLALRPQRRVDLEERIRGEPDQLAGDPRGDRVGVLAHEDDVDVADVVELAGAALAHRDDGQPRGGRVVAADRPGRDDQCGTQRGVGEVGQVSTDGRGTPAPARSPRSAQGRAPPAPVRDPGRACAATTFKELASVGVSATAAKSRCRSAAEGRVTLPASRCQDCGCATRWSPSAYGRTEHAEEPPRSARSLSSARCSSSQPLAERLGEPHHGAQRAVGICRARQRPQQLDVLVGVPAQPVQVLTWRGLRPVRACRRWAASVAVSRVWAHPTQRLRRRSRSRTGSATGTGRPSARTA